MTRRPTASSCIRHELKAGMTTVVTRCCRDFVGTVLEPGQHRGVIVDYHNCTPVSYTHLTLPTKA